MTSWQRSLIFFLAVCHVLLNLLDVQFVAVKACLSAMPALLLQWLYVRSSTEVQECQATLQLSIDVLADCILHKVASPWSTQLSSLMVGSAFGVD